MVWPGGTANSGKGLVHLVELEGATLGELHGAADHFGRVGEELFHFRRAFHVELVGIELEALGVVDGVRGLDAEQDFVGVGVVVAEVVGVVGGDEGDVELFFQLNRSAWTAFSGSRPCPESPGRSFLGRRSPGTGRRPLGDFVFAGHEVAQTSPARQPEKPMRPSECLAR